jgi:beta-glucanase (GH16 family)
VGSALVANSTAITSAERFEITPHVKNAYQTDFFDDFVTWDNTKWQDQIIWVNNERQEYVRDNLFSVRDTADSVLNLKLKNLGYDVSYGSYDKWGVKHPPTPYVAGRVCTKNLFEAPGGKWTARLRFPTHGVAGMFPAFWLLGNKNDEGPIQHDWEENTAWPLRGSSEIDIVEHFGTGGSFQYIARLVRSMGYVDHGDLTTYFMAKYTDIDQWHEYSVEWRGNDILVLLDHQVIQTWWGQAQYFQDDMFAILDYGFDASGVSMTGEWTIQVDWVKHETYR